MGNQRIGLGTPFTVIDTVQDALEGTVAGAQLMFQSHAVLRLQDFPGIGRADRGQQVGVHDARFHQVDAAVVQVFLVENSGRSLQAEIGQDVVPEYTLVPDVVDGQHRFGLFEQRVPGVQRLEVDRHQRRVPVVNVENVRCEVQPLAHLDRRPGQERKADVLVKTAIQLVAMEQLGTPEHVDVRCKRLRTDPHDVENDHLAADVHFHALQLRYNRDVQRGFIDRRVHGHQQPEVVAFSVEVGGERRGDIGQSAGLGVRRHLGSGEADFQAVLVGHVCFSPGGGIQYFTASQWRESRKIIMQDRINLTIENDVAFVELNRPEKHNALDLDMFRAIAAVQKTLRRNRTLRAVVLGGAGVDFCSGLDVKSLMKDRAGMVKLLWKWHPWRSNLAQVVSTGWRDLPVPVIAAIHGRCWGGGLQVALGADFRLVKPDASVSVMEGRWGLIPDMGGTLALREITGRDHAMWLSMSAQVFDGRHALDLGLATALSDDPLAGAKAMAAELGDRSPDTVAAVKRLYRKSWNSRPGMVLARESIYQVRILAGRNQRIAAGRQMGSDRKYADRGRW